MRILLTGGGTAGHVMPNIAIAAELRHHFKDHPHKLNLLYIGSKSAMDRELVEKAGIHFEEIHTGKLRRYFSLQNFVDLVKVPMGFFEAIKLIKKFNPDVIFSKGGYVAVPVVLAGWVLRRKIVIHESDLTPGLATKITGRFADKILVSQEETIKKYPRSKRNNIENVGLPIRPQIVKGSRVAGYGMTKFTGEKPIILVMGGSLGAMKINHTVWASLVKMIPDYQIAHICGKGKTAKTFSNFLMGKLKNNYKEYEFVGKELPDLYSIADVVVTRAGANSLAEVAAFGIPAIVVPLPAKFSRGDQIDNAKLFRQKDDVRYKIIYDKNFNSRNFIEAVEKLSKLKRRPIKTEKALKPIFDIAKILLSYK